MFSQGGREGTMDLKLYYLQSLEIRYALCCLESFDGNIENLLGCTKRQNFSFIIYDNFVYHKWRYNKEKSNRLIKLEVQLKKTIICPKYKKVNLLKHKISN